MNNWSEFKIGKHIRVIPGCPFDARFFSDEYGMPLIRIRDIFSTATEVRYSGNYSNEYLVNHGDVIIGMDGDFNIARWRGQLALLNQRMLKLVENNGSKLNLDYLYYVLIPLLLHINNITPATTVKHLSNYDISDAIITAPDYPVQQKIAAILSTIDGVIEKTEALIEKYQSIKQGMMHDLFTRGVNEHGELRPSYEEAPHLYKESELGWIPKEWEIKTLRQLAIEDLRNGYFKDPAMVGSGYKLINVSELYQDFGININYDSVERVQASDVDYRKFGVDEGDVFYTRSSLVLEGIAACNIALEIREKTLFECHVIRLRPNKEIVVPEYIAFYSKTSRARAYLMGQAKQVTMTTISQPDIAKMPILYPQWEEQKMISENLKSIQHSLVVEKKYLQKVNCIKQGLMQDLLTGKVPVSVD